MGLTLSRGVLILVLHPFLLLMPGIIREVQAPCQVDLIRYRKLPALIMARIQKVQSQSRAVLILLSSGELVTAGITSSFIHPPSERDQD
ncbi:MAG: hypothetical protein AUI36_41840 [Cyanobacteria bacterium 13_1_40CM_2_61_4]|nr:MAG: hypothetical protein AUI36_41840 [Cyanobacteria bacterium 13_1_40CM_2_61_4]